MNLKENINRIKQMMGIINESIFFRRRIDLDEVKKKKAKITRNDNYHCQRRQCEGAKPGFEQK